MEKDICVRPAQNKDVPQLVHWMRCLKAHTENKTNDVYIQSICETQDVHFTTMFTHALCDETQQVFVAEKAGQAIGFILGRVSSAPFQPSSIDHIGEIDLCWVEPDYRRMGVGRALVKALEQWFGGQGLRFVDLHYLIGNVEAEESWTRLGYIPYRVTARKAM